MAKRPLKYTSRDIKRIAPARQPSVGRGASAVWSWFATICLAAIAVGAWQVDRQQTAQLQEDLARRLQQEKAELEAAYVPLDSLHAKREARYLEISKQNSAIEEGKRHRQTLNFLERQFETFASAVREKEALVARLRQDLARLEEAEALDQREVAAAPAQHLSEAPVATATAGGRVSSQWFGFHLLGTAFPKLHIAAGEPLDMVQERMELESQQQGRIETMVERRTAELKGWHERNDRQVALIEQKIAKARRERDRTAERKAREDLERVMNTRKLLLQKWDKEMMSVLNMDQRQVWFAERVWAVVNAEMGEFMTPAQIPDAKKICWESARGQTGFFGGADLDENDLRVKNAMSAIRLRLFDVDQRMTYHDTVRQRNVARRKGEQERAALGIEEETTTSATEKK